MWGFMDRPEPRVKPQPDIKRVPDRSRTLEECAEVLGRTRESIRQTVARALAKCRRWAQVHGFCLEDLLTYGVLGGGGRPPLRTRIFSPGTR